MKKKHVSKMSVDEIMKAIMSDYIAGYSLKKIQQIYGDFGVQYIKKYLHQSLNYAWYDFFNTGNNDILKREIIKKFIKGSSKKEIKKQYGEYGLFIISKFLQLLPIEKI